MAKRRASPHHTVLFSERVSHGILRSLCAFPTRVTFPCNVTMEDYALNLELLLSQDVCSNNFLKEFQQWNKSWFILYISYLRNDSYLQQGQEGLFPPSHSYMRQPGDTLNENSPNQHILIEEIENTWTLLLSYCMASLSTPVMTRSQLYLHVLQKSFNCHSFYHSSGMWPPTLHPKIRVIPTPEISIISIMTLPPNSSQGQFIGMPCLWL